jgi:protein-S-isoprenylcysteine O-methyltransferase Ste14
MNGCRDDLEVGSNHQARESAMTRWIYFFYGVFCHLLFLATFAYMAGFVGNVFVPKSIDTPEGSGPWALVVDLGLIVLFAVQHSVMAREWFKDAWTRLVPQTIERSTYVLISCLAVIVLMWQWQSLGPPTIWNVEQPAVRAVLWVLFAAGWLLVPVASMLINHFDLFGTRQVWLNLRGLPYTPLPFRTPLFYSRVRHPLYVAFTLAFWATPTMTLGHAVFAGALTLYMAVAARIEERDLVRHFGETYRAYQQRVPMFVPAMREPGASQMS